ncbi:MAG: hypothetical protein HQ486_06905 [Acidimicrobiaceae bacterium]|nr:hypothetical protein [Acidimicrobiaceae bacterium]
MAIKSRPIYNGFDLGMPAQRHIFVLEGEGALALLEKVNPSHPMLGQSEILYSPVGSSHEQAIVKLNAANFFTAPSSEILLNRFAAILSTATMSTRLYAAGTEGFIGAAVNVAARYGVKSASIVKEHRGSLRRRVQCVHCKGFNSDITASPFHCEHCKLYLFVRDHFSTRLNAFQGVCVNAEEPHLFPEPVELYQ